MFYKHPRVDEQDLLFYSKLMNTKAWGPGRDHHDGREVAAADARGASSAACCPAPSVGETIKGRDVGCGWGEWFVHGGRWFWEILNDFEMVWLILFFNIFWGFWMMNSKDEFFFWKVWV